MNNLSKQSIILFDWQLQQGSAQPRFRGGVPVRARNRFDQGSQANAVVEMASIFADCSTINQRNKFALTINVVG
jgi:hypothetical protein